MTAYVYITASLLLYPMLGYVAVRQSDKFPQTQKKIVWMLCLISMLTILGLLINIITISQNLNWFLLTSIYLTISALLCLTQYNIEPVVKNMGRILQIAIFSIGYLFATLGFFFILLASFDLDSEQRKWLTDDIIYIERNTGQGPDPLIRLKKIEVYKKAKLFPVLAYRIYQKTYDDRDLPLKQNLDVSFSENDQKLYLTSVVNGFKVFNFADTINLMK
jgi:hypothetical protein